jgi:hypothetical protein
MALPRRAVSPLRAENDVYPGRRTMSGRKQLSGSNSRNLGYLDKPSSSGLSSKRPYQHSCCSVSFVGGSPYQLRTREKGRSGTSRMR